ncbi:hypothetical protein GCM10029963_22700 [Micromonospora andamanensis]
MTTIRAPVSAGMAHCNIFNWRWQDATFAGVCWFGSVTPSTEGRPALASRMPSSRLYPVTARAPTVSAVFTVLARPTPACAAIRGLSVTSSPTAPARWAPIAAAFTGVHRFQPVDATGSRWVESPIRAAAPLTPKAPIREPPNQAARPRSCIERSAVWLSDIWSPSTVSGAAAYPPRAGLIAATRAPRPPPAGQRRASRVSDSTRVSFSGLRT